MDVRLNRRNKVACTNFTFKQTKAFLLRNLWKTDEKWLAVASSSPTSVTPIKIRPSGVDTLD